MSSNNSITDIKSKFKDLCRELNMDKKTEETSWKSFETISKNFTLDGDISHWLCCALYAACRESFVPTVGNSDSVVQGNCVSLTKILRSCNISIGEFFQKIKNWIELGNLSGNFLSHIERLEKSFAVSLVLYRQYNETFESMFIIPANEKKNKKSRPGKCSANKLYDFGWCLFLCAKGEEPKNTVDLVTEFRLLLCCLDLIFVNAVAESRTDIINPNFPGLPPKWNTPEFDAIASSPICVIETLRKMHDVSYEEANSMKMFSWKTIISNFFESKTLQGNSKNFLEIISNKNFEPNLKSLNNTYEQYVLSVGDFDERIFLTNASFRRQKSSNDSEKEKHMNTSIKSLIPGTPYTRRHLLPTREISEPVASATQNVKKLELIAERETSYDFLQQAGDDILSKLEKKLQTFYDKFVEKYPSKLEAPKRFRLAKSLYYYLLEKIVYVELRSKPNLDLKTLLDIDLFQSTLIACCVEIVIAAYNTNLRFPWLLECFDLKAFHFYKIIELVVSRHEDALTRFLIIHLNAIEENCLDSLVWQSNSPLWEAIRQWDGTLPSWVQVNNTIVSPNTGSSRRTEESSVVERNILQSPMNSAYESFNQANNESARRDLFNVGRAETLSTQRIPNEPNRAEGDINGRKRAGSLQLFCRKFYKLAYIRISELCKKLQLRDEEHLKHIWTIFEYTIVNKTDLMKDRHLDQIIMCAIYVFIKVKEIPGKTFSDIMKFYRDQPQAASNIYREVVINPAKYNNGVLVASAVKKDIIQFYNSVYVPKVNTFALKFSGDSMGAQNLLLLSPHPPEKLHSPRKIAGNHCLYIQPLEKKDVPMSPNNFTYEFAKSPAKDLVRINNIVRSGKRNLPFNDEESDEDHINMKKSKPIIDNNTMNTQRTAYIPKKVQGIIQERQEEKK